MKVKLKLGYEVDVNNVDDLWGMVLNDSVYVGVINNMSTPKPKLTITRVFGGWNYAYFHEKSVETVFVKGPDLLDISLSSGKY